MGGKPAAFALRFPAFSSGLSSRASLRSDGHHAKGPKENTHCWLQRTESVHPFECSGLVINVKRLSRPPSFYRLLLLSHKLRLQLHRCGVLLRGPFVLFSSTNYLCFCDYAAVKFVISLFPSQRPLPYPRRTDPEVLAPPQSPRNTRRIASDKYLPPHERSLDCQFPFRFWVR